MSQHDLEVKSFGPFEIKSEDKGEVVAIVATLGVVDKDGDVIMPGAFPPGGSKVKLSGYSHDVITDGAAPVGKGTVYERDGRAYFEGKFFMSTQRGREAFLTTKELGTEGEWSFGFPKAVKTGELSEDWKAKGARRVIAGLTPIEASPVFVGAGWGTGTLLTKSDDKKDLEEKAESQPDGDPEPTPLEVAAEQWRLAGEAKAEMERAEREAQAAAEKQAADEAEAKRLDAQQLADAALKAQRDDAVEEYHRVRRTLKRLGY